MKRLVLTLTIALSLISLSSFASDVKVNPAALKSFNSSFKSATEVTWTISKDYYKANFTLSGQFVSAYYSAEGKMIALTRNISSTQLPISLQANMKKNYDGFWITDLFEMTNEDGTTYYVTLENADTSVILKSNNQNWEKFKKQSKS
ncbi:MAG: hypothetical protein ACXWCZ_00850 [Flavisolibacter sp.]